MHRRVLILGTTGLEKHKVATNVRDRIKDLHQHEYQIIDFERDCFKVSGLYKEWSSYLSQTERVQHQIWNDAWKSCATTFGSNPATDTPTILLLHSVCVRENYGIRSILDINDVCHDFQPTLVINLIDDIYKMWWRTEGRAKGELFKGRPTFEQLLLARRAEMLFGDLLSNQRSLKRPARHVVCSVNHPSEVLVNIILHDSKVVYLSFPISAARELLEEDDATLANAINDLHNRALDQMQSSSAQVFISPLAIDELPFQKAAIIALENSEKEFEFDMVSRWPLKELWNDAGLLGTSEPIPRTIPVDQLKHTHGLILTDVGWRDYKLVSQSDALAIFCPIAPNRKDVSRGVRGEWQKASEESIRCYVYQKKAWDKSKALNKLLETGSMGSNTIVSTSHRVGTIEELFTKCMGV